MGSRKAVDRDQAERRCCEHLTLIDWLLGGQEGAAADFLRQYLRNAVHRTATGTTHTPPLGAQEACAGAAALGREAPDRARRTESGGDRQKPRPLCCSDGRSLGDRFQIRIQPVASAGNASAKAVAARRYPTVEHKGARARQSRARKLAVQECRDCKLRQLRRISLTASWGGHLFGVGVGGSQSYRRRVGVCSVIWSGRKAEARYGRRRNHPESLVFSVSSVVAAVGATWGTWPNWPPPAYRTVDGVWLPMCDRGRALCAGQAHHVA